MADRAVRQTAKNQDGDITALCNPNEDWSRVTKPDAIKHIQEGTHRYHVEWASDTTQIRVVDGADGPYLRTDRDNSPTNNLDDLPDC